MMLPIYLETRQSQTERVINRLERSSLEGRIFYSLSSNERDTKLLECSPSTIAKPGMNGIRNWSAEVLTLHDRET